MGNVSSFSSWSRARARGRLVTGPPITARARRGGRAGYDQGFSGDKNMFLFFESGVGRGKTTATAGTAIVVFIQGMLDKFTYLTRFSYKAGGTAHVATCMRKVAETTLAAAAAADQAVITLQADPGSIATHDHLAIKRPDGTWHHGIVQSVSGLDVTLTANVPAGGFASGARVIFYGVPGDTQHNDFKFDLNADTAVTWPAGGDGILCRSSGSDEPLILSINNVTHAGTLQHVQAHYSRQ